MGCVRVDSGVYSLLDSLLFYIRGVVVVDLRCSIKLNDTSRSYSSHSCKLVLIALLFAQRFVLAASINLMAVRSTSSAVARPV